MSTLTKEWLQKTIAELEEERDATPGAVTEDASMALAAMKLALASIEAEAVAYVMADDLKDSSIISTPAYRDLGEAMERTVGDVVALYTTPPAPVSMKDHQIRELVNELRDIAVEYQGTQQLRERIARTVRAAILQGAEPVTTANKLPFEQWLSQQTGTIDVECGCVMTEVFFHWLRVAYEAGNSPMIPDGWVACSERMPERDVDVQVYCADKKEQMVGYIECNEQDGYFRFASLPNGGGVYCQPTHWMPLPAEPQQEAK